MSKDPTISMLKLLHLSSQWEESGLVNYVSRVSEWYHHTLVAQVILTWSLPLAPTFSLLPRPISFTSETFLLFVPCDTQVRLNLHNLISTQNSLPPRLALLKLHPLHQRSRMKILYLHHKPGSVLSGLGMLHCLIITSRTLSKHFSMRNKSP